jgi:uncharacterized protein with NAD-binding domain and iron-sulfur cluster
VPAPPGSKHDVIILGGGAAGVATAFWLSSPKVRDRFGKITLYTQGWRLGGKCATGRNLTAGSRIEEHGLHILMGCYENAFRTIRACYNEWHPRLGSPFHKVSDAFTPEWQLTLMEQDDPLGAWTPWEFFFPATLGTPGDEPADENLFDRVLNFFRQEERFAQIGLSFLDWLFLTLLPSLPSTLKNNFIDESPFSTSWADADTNQRNKARLVSDQIGDHVRQRLTGQFDDAAALFDTPFSSSQWSARRLAILTDLAIAVAHGLVEDDLLLSDDAFDRLNNQDFREWLRSHGATKVALASAPIRALYNLTFAYQGGDASDISNGKIAAGVTLRFVLEATVGYKRAPLWRMNAGMGETVFTPFYQVLTAPPHNVSIELFTRVKEINLNSDGRVGTIKLARQATFVDGGYQPFVVVGGLDCWPSEPLWGQLRRGAALHAAHVDFESWDDDTHASVEELTIGPNDLVILATPPEIIKHVAPQLAARNRDWNAMLEASSSVPTQALQLWMQPTLEDMGWPFAPPIVTAYGEPYDSWADMSSLLGREAWQISVPPKTIGYFCGCLQVASIGPDPGATARAQANDWLDHYLSGLWPNASHGGAYNSGLEVSRYTRANVDPTELYVQTPPGSVATRLSPRRAYFGNLYVAGDWTLTRFSGGCFESAIESGMLVAAAICGSPSNIVGS